MSCEQLWSRESSMFSTSSGVLRKPSLADAISGTIDLAVGRATSLHGRGLDSALHWPSRPGVVTRTSGRPMSITYDDIISRSLLANCKSPALNNVRKRKADELNAFPVFDVVSRTLIDQKLRPKTLKEEDEDGDGEDVPDVPKSLDADDLGTASRKPEATKVVSGGKARPVASQPVELKATAELTSIPNSMTAPKLSVSRRLKTRRVAACPVKSKTSRRGMKPGENRLRGGVDNKATPPGAAKDAEILYVSLTPGSQTSRESFADEGCAELCETAEQKERCEVFTEQFFEMSTEEWNNPDRMFEVMRKWREQQLHETNSQAPLVELANKHFRGQTFSRDDLRDFLRKSYSEQMDRLKNAFQDLLVIEDAIEKVNANEKLDPCALTEVLKASAAKLHPGGSATH